MENKNLKKRKNNRLKNYDYRSPGVAVCDECGSEFFKSASKMSSLCPECAHILYGYENCKHIFENGRCMRCGWNGNISEYIKKTMVKN